MTRPPPERSTGSLVSGKGRVVGWILNPDLVGCDSTLGVMEKVAVDVKITSTEEMNKATKEKDGRFREWATNETGEDGRECRNCAFHRLARRSRPQRNGHAVE